MYSLQMFMPGSHYVVSFGFRQSCFMLLCDMEKVNGLLEVYIKTSSYVKRHESRLDLKRQCDAVEAKPIVNVKKNTRSKGLRPFQRKQLWQNFTAK